jgi:hypothetical protein
LIATSDNSHYFSSFLVVFLRVLFLGALVSFVLSLYMFSSTLTSSIIFSSTTLLPCALYSIFSSSIISFFDFLVLELFLVVFSCFTISFLLTLKTFSYKMAKTLFSNSVYSSVVSRKPPPPTNKNWLIIFPTKIYLSFGI